MLGFVHFYKSGIEFLS